ncbi:MAG: YesL family protein [Oscillibacter sp.]|nr:YesL family protein [Oscillibacter sp.]
MGNLFNPDAFLWRWCSRILDIMVLSVCWFFCSIPVVTVGAASTALYDAAVHGIRREEAGAYARFFRTFRRELKITIPATLLWGAVIAALAWVGQFVGTAEQEPWFVLAAAAVVVLLLFFALGILAWMFPLLSRFNFSFGGLNRTAWQFTLVHLPSSFLLVVLLGVSAWACRRFLFPVFFVPCTEALLASFLIERAFEKHAPQKKQEEQAGEL